MMTEKYERNMDMAPTEIFASVRKGQAFSIRSSLAEAGRGNDDLQPVKLHAGYSCFKLSIVEEGVFTTGNLKPKDFLTVKRLSEAAAAAEASALIRGALPSGEAGSPGEGREPLKAETVRIRVGAHKNKTPAQVVFEKGPEHAGEQVKALTDTYNWLKDNFDPGSKYAEGNREQMNAIAQAVNLYRKGELKPPSGGGRGTLTLLESGFRTRGDRVRDDGKAFVSSYRIVWNFGNTYPVEVAISNYYARVERKAGGLINVLPQTIDSRVDHVARLSADEWLWALHMMDVTLRSFEESYAPRARALCAKRETENIFSGKEKSEGGPRGSGKPFSSQAGKARAAGRGSAWES